MRTIRALLHVCVAAIAVVGCTEEHAAATSSDGPQSILIEGALSQEDALKGLNENMPSLVPCTRAAGGQFVLMLSWRVLPNGATSKIRVSRRQGEIDATLRDCVTDAMKGWKFPERQVGTRIEQVPVKVGVKT